MHSTLQLDALKILLKSQYGVPDGVLDGFDNIYRQSYRECREDLKRELAEKKDEEDEN